MIVDLVIARLGAQGDGVADTPAGPVFVPYTLPGEIVTAEMRGSRGTLTEIRQTALQRVAPSCLHFGTCGGCLLQHLADEPYRAWKRDLVVRALAARGIEAPVADLVPCMPATRRRVTFSARREAGRLLLGYNGMGTHDIVDVVECPIALPAIVAALGGFRRLADLLCPAQGGLRLTVTATQTGFDVAVSGGGPLSEGKRRAAVDLAIREDFARLSVNAVNVLEARKPVLRFGAASVAMPPAGFVQATAPAEAAMAGLVEGHFAGAKRTADLFAGMGTFALRLAAFSEVLAVESDRATLAALDLAARQTPGLRPVTVERRDLYRRPLTPKELGAFDGVVFDPPRAGAEDQAVHIAASSVTKVAAVSCAPATLARDLRILIEGGYTLLSVVPIDQFLWSPHVEAVALLEKPRKRRG